MKVNRRVTPTDLWIIDYENCSLGDKPGWWYTDIILNPVWSQLHTAHTVHRSQCAHQHLSPSLTSWFCSLIFTLKNTGWKVPVQPLMSTSFCIVCTLHAHTKYLSRLVWCLHQNEGYFTEWHACWCQTGWPEPFRNRWYAGILLPVYVQNVAAGPGLAFTQFSWLA